MEELFVFNAQLATILAININAFLVHYYQKVVKRANLELCLDSQVSVYQHLMDRLLQHLEW
jgi:hypothetical protein